MPERNYHHGDLRNALVRAGLVLLEQEGVSAVSLRSVAREVGVSQAAPYAHFADKRELMSGIAAVGFSRLRDLIAPLASDPERSLSDLGLAYIEFATKNPGLYTLMFGSAEHVDPQNEELVRVSREAFSQLAGRTARRGLEGSDPGPIAAWGLVHGLSMLLITQKLPAALFPSLPDVLRLLEPGIAGHVR